MDAPHTQEFHVRNLPTRSVTLFPTRAQVVRDLKDVVLKPGPNEITVIGVTPTVDQHSIKVEGTGTAIITDITVELLPNRDIFQEIYPESDSDDDDDESDSDDDDEDKVDGALEEVREQLVALGDKQKSAKEIIASAETRLHILDDYGKALQKKRSVEIEASVETYRKEREKVFKDHMDGVALDRDLEKQITKWRREQHRLIKLQVKEAQRKEKEKAKARRAKEKLREKQRRRDEEKQKEKARIRKEREQFWPKSCYTVRISLDAAGGFTPGSSRRSSIASAADVHIVSEKEPEHEETTTTCELTLSYVTSSAFWGPSYDLALSSTNSTAMLCFDARLTNLTSETWSNTKVILSTSQANFSGLQDSTPNLVPWRLKIVGKGGPWDGLDVVHSREERNEKQIFMASQNAASQQKTRAGLFGNAQSEGLQRKAKPFAAKSMAPQGGGLFGNNHTMNNQVVAQQPQQASLFGAPAQQPVSNAFGAPPPGANQTRGFGFGSASTSEEYTGFSNTNSGLFGAPKAMPTPQQMDQMHQQMQQLSQQARYAEGDVTADFDAQTMLEPAPEVTFQDSSFEETGLTATYDLPHIRTLKPAFTASKQRVARVSFTNVIFARTVVAKYKPAAYLRARLRNTSKLTLLRGPTGLTLDGTFLGRSTLPRCSAGDSFNIPLGVDPAIRVAYPKPDVTRSTTGMFTKGDNSLYTRSITLVNTRASAGKPVAITVLDQVPVSEDERLKVDVLYPYGLLSGKTVATGNPGKEGKDEADWGKASAVLKKAGEVDWQVMLNAGRSVKLVLQYEIAFPTGEKVTQV
ncbi:hypothetical protein N0V88_003256 [Collariella sp. IMI 366227]|nr:hypothetical protein N0V88_003256 [Collariella sp. IMI 366227]